MAEKGEWRVPVDVIVGLASSRRVAAADRQRTKNNARNGFATVDSNASGPGLQGTIAPSLNSSRTASNAAVFCFSCASGRSRGAKTDSMTLEGLRR